MDIVQILHDLVFDYTLRTVALGSATLGIVSGVLGAFAVLRKQSLLGDAISHAALPGVALVFLITGSKEAIVLVSGAIVAGWVGTLSATTSRISMPGLMGNGMIAWKKAAKGERTQ